MKRFKPRLFLLYIIPILGLLFPYTVLSDVVHESNKKGNKKPLVIKSNTLEMDNKRRIVIFSGNVDAQGENLLINCQKMNLYFHNKKPHKDIGQGNMKIDKIIAEGKVKITRTEGGMALAEKAVYHMNSEKVVLTGNPVVKQGNDFVEGARIILFLNEKRSIVEGTENKKVRAVISPRSDKGSIIGR